jgi:hypothetical protein
MPLKFTMPACLRVQKKSGNNEKHMNKRRRMSGENDAYEQHHYKKIAVCS